MGRPKEGPYLNEYRRFEKSVDEWLATEDRFLLLHVREIAKALDAQLADGGLQSAMANTFHVALSKLERKRPAKTEEQEVDPDLGF